MSRRAKIFFGTSCAVTALIIWGVHAIQVAEQDNMYQGVIKDEERIRAKAAALAATNAAANASTQAAGSPVALERQLEYERNLKLQAALKQEQTVAPTSRAAMEPSMSSTTSPSSSGRLV